jgi:hypothetical protein
MRAYTAVSYEVPLESAAKCGEAVATATYPTSAYAALESMPPPISTYPGLLESDGNGPCFVK